MAKNPYDDILSKPTVRDILSPFGSQLDRLVFKDWINHEYYRVVQWDSKIHLDEARLQGAGDGPGEDDYWEEDEDEE